MRLTSIRLAGFKSFVEPTQFAVPSQLVGVVGPNGCGKSNIIDAVRWVLGESKASELRGESMQDVIFNGSVQRKPASRASVELVFDNTDQRAGGSWNQYNEISVKRVLTRDGTSSYYINQQPVRRRDVHDIFMGTGLGPRAYAIIGQGMIARIIEARPEELRIFLEEAAGVSKYKERRRETANRLTDTHDNLTRVEDIRRELGGQIERLQVQAEVAKQYQSMAAQRQHKQHVLWHLKCQEAEHQLNDGNARLAEAQAQLEAVNTQSLKLQTDLHLLRQKQMEGAQQLEQKQTDWVEANKHLSRIEADCRIAKETRQRLTERLAEMQAEQANWQVRLDEALAKQEALQDESEVVAAQFETVSATFEEAELALSPFHETLTKAKQQEEKARTDVFTVQKTLSGLASTQEAASRAKTSIETKLARIAEEQKDIKAPDDHALQDVLNQIEHTEALLTELDAKLHELRAQLQDSEQHHQQLDAQCVNERSRLTNAQAQLDALQELAQQVSESGAIQSWLATVGLSDTPTLLAQLSVEPGWEKAVENALRECLNAYPVGQLNTMAALAKSPSPVRLAFIETQEHAKSVAIKVMPADLASVLSCRDAALQNALHNVLQGYRLADSIEQALARRADLLPHERWVTQEGHLVGPVSMQLYAAEDAKAGQLERMQKIEALRKEVRALDMLVAESLGKKDKAQRRQFELKQQLQALETEQSSTTRKAHDLAMQKLRLEELKTRVLDKQQQLVTDRAGLKAELEEQNAILMDSEQLWAEGDAQLADLSEALEACKHAVTDAEANLQQHQQLVQQQREHKQTARLQIEHVAASLSDAAREYRTAQQQLQNLKQRHDVVSGDLARMVEAPEQAELQEAIEAVAVAEEAMAEARMHQETLMAEISQQEQAERQHENLSEPLRSRINEWQLKIQAASIAMTQFSEQLQEAQADRAQIAQWLFEQVQNQNPVPKPAALQADINRLNQVIQELGAVNLAALNELQAAEERKGFLDRQAADLLDAITTLEAAIARIDQETRTVLQETFNTVNQHFGVLFPKLFGGGEAKLVMTGEEILDAGVQVFAQPPGKRNGTIHLLSGGEKALTATALVFAMFALNPAPFCLLDEVDAPLDDANTERFCRLVQQMATQTQFLFISHNKIAMEMAEQLIGVTMQEKGVSRIVAVDLAAAQHMATENV